jgi:hypothetical protein
MTSREHLRLELRTLRWTVRCYLSIRRQLRSVRVDEIHVPERPAVPNNAKHLSNLFMRLVVRNCLVGALIRQEWYRAQGMRKAVVIGVRPPDRDFQAHAWLEGDDPTADGYRYEELTRLPAR